MKNNLSFKIGNRKIGVSQPVFIVAEISGNHNQSFERAKRLVEEAARCGADAVKLQTYTPDTITINSDKEWFFVRRKDNPDWNGKTLYELYKMAYTPWEWQPKLKKMAEDLGLILFSSPFDETAVDFLQEMNVLCYKVASYEAIHIPLLEKIASTGKPVIISIGFASLEEVSLAINTLRSNGAKDIAVLHCVTTYSDSPRLGDMNLETINNIQKRFNVVSGFSDNNTGIKIPVIAVAIGGAAVVEKHFTLNRADGGPDARFSLEPKEFKEMVVLIRRVEKEGQKALENVVSWQDIKKALGEARYGPASDQERENMFFRPSLWVDKNVKKGGVFNLDNIRVARPSTGLPPKFFNQVIGKKTTKDIKEITPLSWDLIQR